MSFGQTIKGSCWLTHSSVTLTIFSTYDLFHCHRVQVVLISSRVLKPIASISFYNHYNREVPKSVQSYQAQESVPWATLTRLVIVKMQIINRCVRWPLCLVRGQMQPHRTWQMHVKDASFVRSWAPPTDIKHRYERQHR